MWSEQIRCAEAAHAAVTANHTPLSALPQDLLDKVTIAVDVALECALILQEATTTPEGTAKVRASARVTRSSSNTGSLIKGHAG